MKKLMVAIVVGLVGCSQISDVPDVTDVIPVVTTQSTNAPVSMDAVPLSSCTIYEANKAHILNFKQTLTISNVRVEGGFVKWDGQRTWKDVKGCNADIWTFLEQPDGSWLASPGDNVRTGQNYKHVDGIKIYNGTEELRPKKKQRAAIMLSTRCRHSVYPNGMERSNVVLLQWPN